MEMRGSYMVIRVTVEMCGPYKVIRVAYDGYAWAMTVAGDGYIYVGLTS